MKTPEFNPGEERCSGSLSELNQQVAPESRTEDLNKWEMQAIQDPEIESKDESLGPSAEFSDRLRAKAVSAPA
jgi:hypothetical protein